MHIGKVFLRTWKTSNTKWACFDSSQKYYFPKMFSKPSEIIPILEGVHPIFWQFAPNLHRICTQFTLNLQPFCPQLALKHLWWIILWWIIRDPYFSCHKIPELTNLNFSTWTRTFWNFRLWEKLYFQSNYIRFNQIPNFKPNAGA